MSAAGVVHYSAASSNESVVECTGQCEPHSLLTPKQTCFLIVTVLALINAILALIYGYIRYKEKHKNRHGYVQSYDTALQRRKSSVNSNQSIREKRRKTSTHIILNAGKRESVRRVSSNLL